MKNFWNDINVYNVNSIKRYASGYPIDRNNNPKIRSLNGLWNFLFCKNIYEIPENFYLQESENNYFEKIEVPLNLQIKSYEIPIYTNIVYPKAIETTNLFKIPNIKGKKNSVGLYTTFFDLEEIGKENIFINFGGINSCAEIYVNGEFVGYSEDSFDQQEYDITKFVKKGKNKLAVTVYRYCTGSYLEDQDMWRISGIFRDVILIFKPKVEIADFFAKSKIDNENNSAVFYTSVQIDANGDKLENGKIILKLSDKENNIIYEEENNINVINEEQKLFLDIETNLKKVTLWSHENPYLYNIEIELFDGEEFIDKRKCKFGFRSIEIQKMKDGRGPFILLNGKPIKFCGVNRHDFHPDYGHAVPKEITKKDLELCLQNNITAIRNSHYPNTRDFYEMCDEMGILVIAENNLETHGLSFMIPNSNKKWTKNCVYRMKNMVNSYKNHSCIICWSLGNEAGFGKAFIDMREAALNIDDTRFIHYHPDTTGKVSDVVSDMYINQEFMKTIGENKKFTHCKALWKPFGTRYKSEKYKDLPFMQCEYSHAMGNSLGNFSDYWEDFKKYDRLSGGFIWDFADQSIKYTNKNGIDEWRYGGDFGDKPNSGGFAFNGIFRADRSPNPSLFEVKKQYQQVDFSYDKNILTIKNRFLFTNLEQFGLRVILLMEGIEIKREEYQIRSIMPNEEGNIEIDLPIIDNNEITIIAEMYLKEDKGCLRKNHIIAYEQFVVQESFYNLKYMEGDCSFAENEWEIVIQSNNLRIILDKKTGGIISINKYGEEKLKSPILPNFWRAPIDNDRLASFDKPIAHFLLGTYKFRNAMKNLKPKNIKVYDSKGLTFIEIEWKMNLLKSLNTVYCIGQDGIDISMNVVSRCELIRYGFTFALREGIDGIKFYGKGPFENYCDRNTGALLRKYEGKAEDFIHNYLFPQENGNHTGTRYLDIGEKNGMILIAEDKPFEFSIHPYTLEMLDNAKHLHELDRLEYLTINIDGRQRGVGGDTPAMACLKPQYKILPKKEHTLHLRMIIK